MTSGNAHEHRGMAESFGTDPERYHRTRPSYPPELAAGLLGARRDLTVLDVGIGTGISAEIFRESGCRVTGVDADPRMAAYAREQGYEVEVGRFEEWDAKGRDFDLVISGQAWHWVDPVAGAIKAADVLRPGGELVVFRNDGLPLPELTEQFARIYDDTLPGTLASRQWRRPPHSDVAGKTVEDIRESERFLEPEVRRYEWTREYTRDQWLDEVPTTGVHTQLSPEVLTPILARLGDAVDDVGGRFTMNFTTTVVLGTAAAR